MRRCLRIHRPLPEVIEDSCPCAWETSFVFGPASEVYGRKVPLFIGYIVFAIFQIPVAVAQNLQTIMIFRFLIGVFGCSPLAVLSKSANTSPVELDPPVLFLDLGFVVLGEPSLNLHRVGRRTVPSAKSGTWGCDGRLRAGLTGMAMATVN